MDKKKIYKSKAAGGRLKSVGRPVGSPNKGSDYPRNYVAKFRCTEGFLQVIEALQLQDPARKLSEADIMHDALQMYAVRKLSKKNDLYWVNKIQ